MSNTMKPTDGMSRPERIAFIAENIGAVVPLSSGGAIQLATLDKVIELIGSPDLPPNPLDRPACPAKRIEDSCLVREPYRKAMKKYLGHWIDVSESRYISWTTYESLADYCESKVNSGSQK